MGRHAPRPIAAWLAGEVHTRLGVQVEQILHGRYRKDSHRRPDRADHVPHDVVASSPEVPAAKVTLALRSGLIPAQGRIVIVGAGVGDAQWESNYGAGICRRHRR